MITRTLGLFFLTIALFLGGGDACLAQSAPAASGPGGEEAAIMDVIQGESTAFWNKDFDAWAGYWAHEPYVRIMGWWEAGGISVREGWEEISTNMMAVMRENPEPNPTASLVRRENVSVHVVGDMALVTFDQYGLDTGDERMDMPGRSRESRVLERKDGVWRLIYVGWLLEGGEDEE